LALGVCEKVPPILRFWRVFRPDSPHSSMRHGSMAFQHISFMVRLTESIGAQGFPQSLRFSDRPPRSSSKFHRPMTHRAMNENSFPVLGGFGGPGKRILLRVFSQGSLGAKLLFVTNYIASCRMSLCGFWRPSSWYAERNSLRIKVFHSLGIFCPGGRRADKIPWPHAP